MKDLADIAMSKTKIRLMERPSSAFFTHLCFSLKHVWDPAEKTAAAYAKAKMVKWNKDFFMSLVDIEEKVFVMVHETMHIAYLHSGRCGKRDPLIWNYACDFVINLQLVERGFKMPTGNNAGLLDYRFDGMSAEQVYDILIDENFQHPGAFSMDIKPGDPEEEITKEVERQVQDILVRAMLQSRAANDKPGTIPSDIAKFLDDLLNPKLPWHQIYRKELQAFNKTDYSFMKPNRRHFPRHYLPSLWSKSLMSMAWAVDCSGSVSDHEFKRIATEGHSCIRMMMPPHIDLIQFDTRIIQVDRVKTPRELMKVKFNRYGGTDITPVLEWANTHKPQCLTIFTDGEFRWPDIATKVPTIWLIHNNPGFKAPFGRVIHYTP